MPDIQYLIREDNVQKVYLTESSLNVYDLLGEHYNYILDFINEEEFILKSPECSLFKELVFDNKVVGFCSYDFSRQFITAALNNIYVIPQFRGNGLFYSELTKTLEEHNKPSIIEPTRLVVELLIKYGFAKKISENIVASSLEFIVPGDHVMSNIDYDSSEELSTHFYDLNTCSSIHFLDISKGHLAYSAPLNYDIIHYDCLDYEFTTEYIKEIQDFFIKNETELLKVILDLEESIPIKSYTLEEIIGDDDSLSHYMESLIDDAHVTYDDALRIKEQIRDEYESGMILNESLLIRLSYLFEKREEPSIKSHSETCPYCHMPVDDHDKYCHFCGINLHYNPDEHLNNLINSFNENESKEREDIRYIAYKFLKLICEKIEYEYAMITVEKTYAVSSDELCDFLAKNNYFNGEITHEGFEFLNTHPLNYYEKYEMNIVNYTDFEKYFYENSDLNANQICLNYLKQFELDEDIEEIISKINNNCLQ